MFGFGNIFVGDMARTFTTTFRCYSVSLLPGQERQDVEKGGKIIMPPSALDTLTRLNIQYPMLFKLTNKRTNRDTHSGVLEFVADEGRIFLPYWMMRNLLLEEGGLLQVESATLPVATFAKFQPQSPDFLDISNPKAVLENALRNFACLTTGDIIAINYNDRIYELCVLETKPGNAVSIIECDMNVEFAAPVGYQEPQRSDFQQSQPEETPMDVIDYLDPNEFRAFGGEGNRLDGKKRGQDSSPGKKSPVTYRRGIPNYEYKKGSITFLRNSKPVVQNGNAEDKEETFEAFSGPGQTLRKKGRK